MGREKEDVGKEGKEGVMGEGRIKRSEAGKGRERSEAGKGRKRSEGGE